MSDVLQKQIGILPTNTPIVTTAETLVAYTGRCAVILPTMRAIIEGWAAVTGGTAATGFQLRIRHGNGITGTVAFSSLVTAISAGVSLDANVLFAESLSNAEYVDYSLTVQVSGASGNSTIIAGGVSVELING